MVNAGIVGATGFAGEELINILLRHPHVRIAGVSAKIAGARPISGIFPKLRGRLDMECAEPDINKICADCDVVFLALPHTVSMEFAGAILKKGRKVIDLSADYRLRDTGVYEKFYNTRHKDPANIKKAVYGLPELYRVRIKEAALIANPGCYPTASILALAPLAALDGIEPDSVVIDAKSGVTGAGRTIAEAFMFSEINEDFRAYKVDCHQHAPEIDQELTKLAGKKMKTVFVPHLLPLNRGILTTVYVKRSRKRKSAADFLTVYKRFYKKEPFVRIKEAGSFPRLRDVCYTNFCDIGIKQDQDRAIVIAAIDNLLKGAAGQAVQNMNIMFGFEEKTALL